MASSPRILFAAPDPGQLEVALRQVASKTYQIPYSRRRCVSVSTLRRYLTLYQEGGFAALHPQPCADKGRVRAFPPEVLDAAIALRAEQPARTTPMLVELLQREPTLKLDQPINAHTLTTQLRQRGHSRRLLGQASRAYRRFERDHSNSLWQGDAMVGPPAFAGAGCGCLTRRWRARNAGRTSSVFSTTTAVWCPTPNSSGMKRCRAWSGS